MSKLILRRLTVPIAASGIRADSMLFQSVVRVLGIAVRVAANASPEDCFVRWSVLSQDGAVTVPTMGAETLPSALGTADDRLVQFMVNQDRSVPSATADSVIMVPGFLPPDLWLLPSEQLRIDLLLGAPGPTLYQVVVSYLDTVEGD